MGWAMEFYRVRHWRQFYEKNHKDSEVVFRWISVPTKHDGKGFKQLARHARRVEIFCAFILILQVAAKMPRRGDLVDEDGPLTAEDLSEETGYPEKIFVLALSVLSDESAKHYWLERVVLSEPSQDLSGTSSPTDRQTEQTEQTEYMSGSDKSEFPPGFVQFWSMYPRRGKERSSRQKCFEAWKKQKLERIHPQVIDGLASWIRSDVWGKDSGQFIVAAHRWIGERRFEITPTPAGDVVDDSGFSPNRYDTPERIEELRDSLPSKADLEGR